MIILLPYPLFTALRDKEYEQISRAKQIISPQVIVVFYGKQKFQGVFITRIFCCAFQLHIQLRISNVRLKPPPPNNDIDTIIIYIWLARTES